MDPLEIAAEFAKIAFNAAFVSAEAVKGVVP